MATLLRIDPAPFQLSDVTPRLEPPCPRQLAGQRGGQASAAQVRVFSQVTPLDERLQPCGAAFLGEIERQSPDSLWLSHTRPVRAPYLAVDVPLDDLRQERVILRVTRCESYGLDYVIRGDVMGS